jgi:hypothetical protein
MGMHLTIKTSFFLLIFICTYLHRDDSNYKACANNSAISNTRIPGTCLVKAQLQMDRMPVHRSGLKYAPAFSPALARSEIVIGNRRRCRTAKIAIEAHL